MNASKSENDRPPAASPKYLPKATVANGLLGFLAAWMIAMQGGWHSLEVLLGLFFAAAAASSVLGIISKDARGNPWQFILMCGIQPFRSML
jgi:hypothetical protein